MTIIEDFKGRKLTLLKNRARKTNGHRYVTRKSVADVLLGLATRTKGGSSADNPVNGWRAKATKTRMNIGCHVFTGENFRALRSWALAA